MTRRHQLKSGGPKAYWAAMRALTRRDGSFTLAGLVERFPGRSPLTVERYLHACNAAGHLDVVGQATGERGQTPFLWAVKVTAPDTAPFEKPNREARLGAVHQQLWTTMRAMPQFTSRELAACASTDDVAIEPDTARIYCWFLRRAGYLQELGRSGRWLALRLKPGMNTGPFAPAIDADRVVVDRNPRARRSAS